MAAVSETASGERRGGGVRLAVLCLGVWLHAANSMLVASTLPSAVREIGGGDLVAWAFALYLLGSILAGATTGALVAGLAVRTGLCLAGLLYLAGCVVAAVAPEMVVVLAGRFLQGVGGGFLVALAYVGLNRWFPPDRLPRLLALVSAVWSLSAFCGPLVGGGFATFGDWRWAFWAFALQAALFVAATGVLMPGEAPPAGRRVALPYSRLPPLSLAILAVAYAGYLIDPLLSPLLCLLGAGLFALVLRLDRRATGPRMFPSRPLALRRRLGAGLCFVLSAAFASMSFLVYGPLLLETLHGLTPLAAGYMVAAESVAWGVAAVAVARFAPLAEVRAIRAGSLLIFIGLAGFAVTVADGPWWLILLCAITKGCGFGVAWAFVIRRVTLSAQPGELDVASSSIPTLQQVGFAFGAAVAGIIANAAGFAEAIDEAAARAAAFWIFAAFLPVALFAVVAAWRLTAGRADRPGSPCRETAPPSPRQSSRRRSA